jgi:hypothetical protein
VCVFLCEDFCVALCGRAQGLIVFKDGRVCIIRAPVCRHLVCRFMAVTDRQTGRQADRHGRTDDGRTDDGRADGRTDGQTDRHTFCLIWLTAVSGVNHASGVPLCLHTTSGLVFPEVPRSYLGQVLGCSDPDFSWSSSHTPGECRGSTTMGPIAVSYNLLLQEGRVGIVGKLSEQCNITCYLIIYTESVIISPSRSLPYNINVKIPPQRTSPPPPLDDNMQLQPKFSQCSACCLCCILFLLFYLLYFPAPRQ